MTPHPTKPIPNLVFYTVTSADYFPGTVATLSSIRTFHPHSPIWVFPESRSPLSREQMAHLKALPGIYVQSPAEVPVGQIKEALQMKAHAALYLAGLYDGVLIQVDSDAVLCANLGEIAAEAVQRGVPIGGRDGIGARYECKRYSPYHALCGFTGKPADYFNPFYTSTSILFLPIPALKEVLALWSQAVDAADFGPGGPARKVYAGGNDQGVFNAILFFKGVTPHNIENDLLSEHWTHGFRPMTFRDGHFYNGIRRQWAFHSVGRAPKFWRRGYRAFVESHPCLEPVYLYWLFHLFDGPCGILTTQTWRRLEPRAEAFFPKASADLWRDYSERRRPRLRQVMQDYGRLATQSLRPRLLQSRKSKNLLCVPIFETGTEERAEIHSLYSTVKSLQNYRSLGGTADVVIATSEKRMSALLNRTLTELMERYEIRIFALTPDFVGKLFQQLGGDVETRQPAGPAGRKPQRPEKRERPEAGHAGDPWPEMEAHLGPYLVIHHLLRTMGYQRGAMTFPVSDEHPFADESHSPEKNVDDIWRFDESSDFVFQETVSWQANMDQLTCWALARPMPICRAGGLFLKFQTHRQWVQGTQAAFGRFIHLLMDEFKSCSPPLTAGPAR